MSNRPPTRQKNKPGPACLHSLHALFQAAGCPILATSFRRKGGNPQSSIYAPLIKNKPGLASRWTLLYCLAVAGLVHAQTPQSTTAPSASPVILDRVVAVVNNQTILASDLDQEIRLSVLDPAGVGHAPLTRQRALEQLIGRALIQQQIRQEDAQAAEPSPAEVDARLAEIRRNLPACTRQNCASEAGWKVFLAAHGLTQERVESYLRYRVQILRFIEQRFRQGIRISPQEIENYYRDTLLPQYAPGEAIPPLDQVSPRIEEILLQQQVNILFDDWLANLRRQGEIEVLDPALAAPQQPGEQGKGSQ
jgi:hypothetical protein